MRLSLLLLAWIIPAGLAQSTLEADLNAAGIVSLLPGKSGYDTSRALYNRRFDIRPAAITLPTTLQEVSKAIIIAKKWNLPVTSRSGGHSYAGNGVGGKDGAFVLDLSRMKAVSVNKGDGIATVGGGIRLGDLALALDAQGRGTSHGICPWVGIGGHATHGGYGLSSRVWGMVVDNVKGATIVLANGTIAEASAAVNSDLLWAIRGAGSSFGVVTSFQIQTYATPPSVTVMNNQYTMSEADAVTALLNFQTFANSGIPAALTIRYNVFRGFSTGTTRFSVEAVWYGPAGEFDALMQPLLNTFPKAQTVSVRAGSYITSVRNLANGQSLDTSTGSDSRETAYGKSLTTPALTRKQAEKFFEYFSRNATTIRGPSIYFAQFELFGGSNSRINSVPITETSFATRDSLFTIQFLVMAGAPPMPETGFTLLDDAVKSIVDNRPNADWKYGAYMNYIDTRLSNWQEMYFGKNYARLLTLKTKYDPQNVFRSQMSVGST